MPKSLKLAAAQKTVAVKKEEQKMNNNKAHWEHIYENKSSSELSWTQEAPLTSMQMISAFNLPKTASIIDIGGGESLLAEQLLEAGYSDLTVLDISSAAIERAKKKLGHKASKVKWIVADILDFKPQAKYELWHDRAAFHFLNEKSDILKYREIATSCVKDKLIIGTFSENGPLKCSGLPVIRYSQQSMSDVFEPAFQKLDCITENHITPFNTSQQFIFCSFERK